MYTRYQISVGEFWNRVFPHCYRSWHQSSTPRSGRVKGPAQWGGRGGFPNMGPGPLVHSSHKRSGTR